MPWFFYEIHILKQSLLLELLAYALTYIIYDGVSVSYMLFSMVVLRLFFTLVQKNRKYSTSNSGSLQQKFSSDICYQDTEFGWLA